MAQLHQPCQNRRHPNTIPASRRSGDRTGTGGVKKPKLTEDELTAKLLAAKERSQNLSAAHARAQADAASFEERERIAQHKRAKEKVERRAMDNERQKNAARKAAAMEEESGTFRRMKRISGYRVAEAVPGNVEGR